MFDLLRYAAPVGLAAMGETVNQKCGLLNIGLEGMMLTGGFCAMLATRQTGNPWLGLLAGILVGLIMALLAGAVMIPLAGDQVVVGAAINLIAVGVTGTIYRNIFGTSGALLSINPLPKFGGGLDAVLIFFILSVPVIWWILFKSKFGLVLRGLVRNLRRSSLPDSMQTRFDGLEFSFLEPLQDSREHISALELRRHLQRILQMAKDLSPLQW